MSNVPPPPPGASMSGVGTPAGLGPRLIARIIDAVILIPLFLPVVILVVIVGQISGALAVLVALFGYLGVIAAAFYIMGWGLGETGQTPGKRSQGVMVVDEASGQPIGGPKGIARLLLDGIINSFCYINWIWAIFDDRNQTISDKVLTAQVVEVEKGGIMPIFPGGNPF